jgi:hypothetical protein
MPNFCTLLEGVGEGAGGGAVHRADGYRTGHKWKSITFQLLKKAFSIFAYNGRYTYLEAVPQLEIPEAPSWCTYLVYLETVSQLGKCASSLLLCTYQEAVSQLRKAACSLMLHTYLEALRQFRTSAISTHTYIYLEAVPQLGKSASSFLSRRLLNNSHRFC